MYPGAFSSPALSTKKCRHDDGGVPVRASCSVSCLPRKYRWWGLYCSIAMAAMTTVAKPAAHCLDQCATIFGKEKPITIMMMKNSTI